MQPSRGHTLSHRDRIQVGVIIEVSSPFWPITALAISMTSGAVGLSPLADPLSPTGPAGLDNKSLAPTDFDAQFETAVTCKKSVDEYWEKCGRTLWINRARP